MKIYVAGSITGKTPDEVFAFFCNTKETLEQMGYEVVSPMAGKGHLRTEKYFSSSGYKFPVSTDHAIARRDRWMVKQSDIIYVNLLSAKTASIGCVSELAWAYDNNKHTILVMQDDNIHKHAFILEMADIIFDNTEAALEYLGELVS